MHRSASTLRGIDRRCRRGKVAEIHEGTNEKIVRHDGRIPVDVDDVPLFGQLQRQVFGLLHVVSLHDDGGPEVPARLDLYDRRDRGHDHGHGYVEPLTVVAQRLRVIT